MEAFDRHITSYNYNVVTVSTVYILYWLNHIAKHCYKIFRFFLLTLQNDVQDEGNLLALQQVI